MKDPSLEPADEGDEDRLPLRNAIINDTIPEEGGSSPENEERHPVAPRDHQHRSKAAGQRRRHRKLIPINQLSLYRQV